VIRGGVLLYLWRHQPKVCPPTSVSAVRVACEMRHNWELSGYL